MLTSTKGNCTKCTAGTASVLVQCPLPLYLVSFNFLQLFWGCALDKKLGTDKTSQFDYNMPPFEGIKTAV